MRNIVELLGTNKVRLTMFVETPSFQKMDGLSEPVEVIVTAQKVIDVTNLLKHSNWVNILSDSLLECTEQCLAKAQEHMDNQQG